MATAKPTFFATPAAFRAWLKKNHATASELVVGYYKRSTGKPSITWPQSVDEALCYGWIDGIRHSLGAEAYQIRFTPRRPGSLWSTVNIRRVAELKKLGLMEPTGIAAFERRSEEKSALYSYEQRFSSAFDKAQEKKFRANKKAWAFFDTQPPWYRRNATYWVTSAKTDATRFKRLDSLIAACESGKRR